MADHSLPSLTSTYADFLSAINGRITDAATMFTGASYSNMPTGSIRYNRTGDYFEEYNGSSWAIAPISYEGLEGANIAGLKSDLGLGSLAYLSSVNNANWSGTALALTNGGTGSATASGARTALGLGTIATQASSAVTITGGTIAGMTSIAGTAATITTITAGTVTSSGGTLNLRASAGNTISIGIDSTEKIGMPTDISDGAAALLPGATNKWTLGTSSLAFKDISTVAVTSPSGQNLTLGAPASYGVNMQVNGVTTWSFNSDGTFTPATRPDYTPWGGGYTTTRSLDPGAATAQTCADAINTMWADIIALGIFQ